MVFLFTLFTAFAYANPVERLAPDFSVGKTSVYYQKQLHDLSTDCRSAIADKICLTTAEDLDSVDMGSRPCVAGGAKYAAVFEALYDRFPARLSKMFCFVEKIFIEPQSSSVAYATMAQDPNGSYGAYVGVGQIYLDSAATLDTIMSWKEQINYGGDTSQIQFSPSLPVAHTSLNSDFTDALYYILAHEFAHVFDFSNHFNNNFGGGPWAQLSWGDDGNVLSQNSFQLLPNLCFYNCSGSFLQPGQQDLVYQQLLPTNFTTTYSTVNAFEDFAETFAIYTLSTERQNPEFKITTASGYDYDLIAKIKTPQMDSKVQFIKDFLAGTIRYPGQN